MNDTERLIALQQRLLDTLRDISEHADILAQERCPYRGVEDVCFLPSRCRNQLTDDSARYCSGAQLNHGRT